MFEQAKQIVRRILHADDSPRKIAWGVALGLFVAATPTLGVQMMVAAALAWLLRGNQAAAVAVVWVTNPYTALPVYWFEYRLGHWLVGGPRVDISWYKHLLSADKHEGWLAYLRFVYYELVQVFWPLWVGSILTGLVWGIVSYHLTYQVVCRYRAYRQQRASRKEETVPSARSA